MISTVFTEVRPSFTLIRLASLALLLEPEEADQAVGLALGGPAHVEDVGQPLQLDGAVHREVGPRALGQRAVEVAGRRPRCRSATAGSTRITWASMTPLRVSTLAFWPICTSLAWVSAMRTTALSLPGWATRARFGAGGHALAHLDGELLQHAVHARLELQGLNLGAAQPGGGPPLLGHRALHGELGLDGLAGDGQPLLLEPVAVLQLLGRDLRELHGDVGDEALGRQLLVGVGAHAGLVELGLHPRRRRRLVHELALEADLELGVRASAARRAAARRPRPQLQLRVRQLEDHRVGLDLGAGKQHEPLDPALGLGGDPADLLGHQGAEAAHLSQHLAALDRVDPDRGPLDAGRGGLEAREAEGDEQNGGEPGRSEQDPAALLAAACEGRAISITFLRPPPPPSSKAVPGGGHQAKSLT